MSDTKLISTTSLSKRFKISTKEMFAELMQNGFIRKIDDTWALTDLGEKIGGQYRKHDKYGKYIVWPEDLKFDHVAKDQDNLITATAVGKHFELSANKINHILSELGWIKKGLKGWLCTVQGVKVGGIQSEDKKSGIPYVRWPVSIFSQKALVNTIDQFKGVVESPGEPEQDNGSGFREKFQAKHRAADGHFVRSKAEMLIDNWLYMAEIVHAYERKLPIEEDVYSDFYIPTGKVYIEYWGYENDKKYLDRKKVKQKIYESYSFNLIELQDKDVLNLDDVLPRLLLKYGVQAY